jgi:hypothetical protein
MLVRPLATVSDLYTYVTNRLGQLPGGSFVRDLTWGFGLRWDETQRDVKNYRAYVAAIRAACARDVAYREVITFHDREMVERASQFMDASPTDMYSYSLRYYPEASVRSDGPPLLSFIVLHPAGGQPEAIVGYYAPPRPDAPFALIHTEPHTVAMYLAYHEWIWSKAKEIRSQGRSDPRILEELRGMLRDWPDHSRPRAER